jgi:queuine tRNA-ribosyltransferase
MLTDSGGFQVFSLGERGIDGREKKVLRRVSEEGIQFTSHLDGHTELMRPEDSIAIQQALGADIIMAFDQPVYGLSSHAATKEAAERTSRWLERSTAAWTNRENQALFGIVQGGTYTDIHTQSARDIVAMDLPGNAIGGLAVGEGKEAMWAATESIVQLLPADKPRYFMGLGTPEDLLQSALRGIDMQDCVAPTRVARHGVAWEVGGEGSRAFWTGDTEALIAQGARFTSANYHNAAFATDRTPLNPYLPFADLAVVSKGSVRHWVKEGEMLALRILTLNNLQLMHTLTRHIQQAIRAGRLNDLVAALTPSAQLPD